MQISEDLFFIILLLAHFLLSMFGAFLVLRWFNWAKGRQLIFEWTIFLVVGQIAFYLTWMFLFAIEPAAKPFPAFLLLQMWMVIFINTPIGAGILTLIKLLRSQGAKQSPKNIWIISLSICTLSCLIIFALLLVAKITPIQIISEQEFKGE